LEALLTAEARPSSRDPLVVGRYAIYDPIAAGGMGTVHLARLLGPSGFSRTVAVKRLHPNLTSDEEFASMLIDEARIAARIRHPNVVSTLDVVATKGSLMLVMEYIHGESVLKLAQAVQARGERVPLKIVGAMLADALHGLHAAHEATDQQGRPLGVVHRDVSPQNLLVGIDGVTRVADFGIAKAAGRSHVTDDASIKGKLAYMAPEQIEQGEVTRAADLFAASIVLWELLTGHKLFAGKTDGQTVHNVLKAEVAPPSEFVPDLPKRLDEIVLRGLARSPADRYATARDMAADLEACVEHVRPSEIGPWVQEVAKTALAERAALIRDIERSDPVPDTEPDVALLARVERVESAPPRETTSPRTRRVGRSQPPAPLPDAEPSYETSRNNAIHVLSGEPAAVKRKRWAPALLAVSVVAGGAAVVALRPHRPTVPRGAAPSVMTSMASETAMPPEPARPDVDAAVAEPTPQVESTAKAKWRPAPKTTASARPAERKPQVQCDPPYTIDSAGTRIFKVECL
jgi:serine/threonine-protein kinase